MQLIRRCWKTSAFSLTFVLAASGCWSAGGKPVVIGTVSGQVSLDGDPLEAGCVLTFLPTSAGAEIGSGLVNDDGMYVAKSGKYRGMPVGDYRVLVKPPRMDPKEEDELTKKNSQAVMTALIKRDRRELEKVEYPQDQIVPRQYWAESTSGLTLTVKEGDNTADFELKSKK